jgi:DNA polymerase (family X)
MTERVVRAVYSPHLTILGHPTGRLLLTREGYAIDIDAVIAAAAETGVAIEINAHPHRLDLGWRHVRSAAAAGVLIAINPDAHSVAALDHVTYGIHVARKAGLQPRQVLNTWPLDEVLDYLARRRRV